MSALTGGGDLQPKSGSALPFASVLQSQQQLNTAANNASALQPQAALSALLSGEQNMPSLEQLTSFDAQSTVAAPWLMLQAQQLTEGAKTVESSQLMLTAESVDGSEATWIDPALNMEAGGTISTELDPVVTGQLYAAGAEQSVETSVVSENIVSSFESSGGGGQPYQAVAADNEASVENTTTESASFRSITNEPVVSTTSSSTVNAEAVDRQSPTLPTQPSRVGQVDDAEAASTVVDNLNLDEAQPSSNLSAKTADTTQVVGSESENTGQLIRQDELQKMQAPISDKIAVSTDRPVSDAANTSIDKTVGNEQLQQRDQAERTVQQGTVQVAQSASSETEADVQSPLTNTLSTTTTRPPSDASLDQGNTVPTTRREGSDAGVSISQRDVLQSKPEQVAVKVETAAADSNNNPQQVTQSISANASSNATATGAITLEQAANSVRSPVPATTAKRTGSVERVENTVVTDGSEGYHWLSSDAEPVADIPVADVQQTEFNSVPVANNTTVNTVNTTARSEVAQVESFSSVKQSVDATASAEAEASAELQDTANLEIETPVRDAQWSQAFAYRVQFMAQQGIQRAQVQLNPAELGPMEITVDVVDDVAQVQITAENAATREAVEQAVPRLREMMAQSGFGETGVDLSGGNDEAPTSAGDASLFRQAQAGSGEGGSSDTDRGANSGSGGGTENTTAGITPVSGDRMPERSADGRLSFYV